jgi:3-isopropylmalate dehydrogenase
MQLVRNPVLFDVIVSDSAPMGGMINSLAALLMGSVGMGAGMTIGLRDAGSFPAMVKKDGLYEPIHGSADTRAGQGIVNPIGTVIAAAMLLRYSLQLEQEASAIERGVETVLAQGYRTYDIMEPGRMKVGTAEMGERIAAAIDAFA